MFWCADASGTEWRMSGRSKPMNEFNEMKRIEMKFSEMKRIELNRIESTCVSRNSRLFVFCFPIAHVTSRAFTGISAFFHCLGYLNLAKMVRNGTGLTLA